MRSLIYAVPLPPVLATFIAYNACVGFDFTYGDIVGRVFFYCVNGVGDKEFIWVIILG
jgi:hypothetical protein